jgi:hypothetical protein
MLGTKFEPKKHAAKLSHPIALEACVSVGKEFHLSAWEIWEQLSPHWGVLLSD